nr:oligopeptide transporter 4-like [Tanacetum cinerariifolium]
MTTSKKLNKEEEQDGEECRIEEHVDEECRIEKHDDEESLIEEHVVEESPIEEHVDEESPIEEHVDEESPIEEHVDEESLIEKHVHDESPIEEPDDEESPIEEHDDPESPIEEHVDEECPIEELVDVESPIEKLVDEESPIEEHDDEESPIEEVRSTVPTTDDSTQSVWTFRMWVLGLASCVLLSCQNQFFSYQASHLIITQGLIKIWNGPQWRAKSRKASQNRNTETDGSVGKHTRGSITMTQQRLNKEKETGGPVSFQVLFEDTHSQKGVENKGENICTSSLSSNPHYVVTDMLSNRSSCNPHPCCQGSTSMSKVTRMEEMMEPQKQEHVTREDALRKEFEDREAAINKQ